MTEAAPASIHRQRRWFYVLWCGLLAAALGTLAAWRVPATRGTAKVRLRVALVDAPSGVRVAVWTGRSEDWARGTAAWTEAAGPDPAGLVALPDQPILVARRRWVRDLHPETTDWVVLRLTPAGGPSRYAYYDVAPDLRGGLLSERRILSLEAPLRWPALSTAARTPSRIF